VAVDDVDVCAVLVYFRLVVNAVYVCTVCVFQIRVALWIPVHLCMLVFCGCAECGVAMLIDGEDVVDVFDKKSICTQMTMFHRTLNHLTPAPRPWAGGGGGGGTVATRVKLIPKEVSTLVKMMQAYEQRYEKINAKQVEAGEGALSLNCSHFSLSCLHFIFLSCCLPFLSFYISAGPVPLSRSSLSFSFSLSSSSFLLFPSFFITSITFQSPLPSSSIILM
jgi:hypothetical protein